MVIKLWLRQAQAIFFRSWATIELSRRTLWSCDYFLQITSNKRI